jgi:hypothetical protein
MFVYIQSEACASIANPADQAACSEATEVPAGKVCSFVAAVGENPAKCELSDKPATTNTTNSSDNLNIFKITLALLIIFTIL